MSSKRSGHPNKRQIITCPICRNTKKNRKVSKRKWVCGACKTEFGFGRPKIKIDQKNLTQEVPMKRVRRTKFKSKRLQQILDHWLENSEVL